MSITLNEILKEAQKNNRICPQPYYWNELHSFIPNNVFSKAGQFAPEPPLILSSWWDTPPLEKPKRFIEHLEWAEAMKKISVLLIFLLISIPAYASEFCDGFKAGYKTGYDQIKGTRMNSLVPFCPLQPFKGYGAPKSDYEHGYIIALKKHGRRYQINRYNRVAKAFIGLGLTGCLPIVIKQSPSAH